MLTAAQAEDRIVYAGQALTLSATFRIDGEPKDPTLVTLRTRSPSGVFVVTTREALANPSTGTWTHTVLADEAGVWHFRIEGAGIVDAVDEFEIDVHPSAFTS